MVIKYLNWFYKLLIPRVNPMVTLTFCMNVYRKKLHTMTAVTHRSHYWSSRKMGLKTVLKHKPQSYHKNNSKIVFAKAVIYYSLSDLSINKVLYRLSPWRP